MPLFPSVFIPSGCVHRSVLLTVAIGFPGIALGFPATQIGTLPLDPPGASTNRLSFEVDASGTVQADLPVLGNQDITIDSSDSDASTVSGELRCEFGLEIDAVTLTATVQSIAFMESQVILDDELSFNLSLGTYIFIPIGSVGVASRNLVVTPSTPSGAGSVTGTTFPLSEHQLSLYGGTITGGATGLAADYIDPIDVNFAETPLEGPIGAGTGTVTISAPSVNGSNVSYDVTVSVPVDFAALILEDPVNVTLTSEGSVKASGTLTIEVPAVEKIEVLALSAGSPTASDVTITWNSEGGAGSYRVLSSPRLSTPLSSWTIEQSSVLNGGATTSFVDSGTLEGSSRKFYVIEEN
ncbi:hypothetical protein ACFQY0_10530 [Haloferula chungangensis]|uniref:Uncharacterized protein n=1 Tax=Haloferula chungangensis TaxID=1048331 RepID=A0ABW2L7I4_9BACT